MKFIDEAKIEIISGNGGNGSKSIRREKFISFGGPNGGDGGKGGNIYALADRNINTLIQYCYIKKYKAENGKNGGKSKCYGKRGKNVILRMPIGTIILDIKTNKIIADLKKDKQIIKIASGGKGGLGNIHFKYKFNKINKIKKNTNGENGEHKIIKLKLKILADVGLFGSPNAGKSTFISYISNAKPKISNYPFTTLKPNLGVVNIDFDKIFTIADIPGIIYGASKGVGLGYKFLKHLQRTSLLLHIIDISNISKKSDFIKEKLIINELKKYNIDLYKKQRWVILNKIDKFSDKKKISKIFNIIQKLKFGKKIFKISSVTGKGCNKLCKEIFNHLKKLNILFNK